MRETFLFWRLSMREERPWGFYEVLEEAPGYKLKRITVKPNSKLSLQRHTYRNETWIMISGVGIITHSSVDFILPGEFHCIPAGDIHRMANPSPSVDVVFYEVQLGERLDENDIERIADDYGRVPY
jgi:mannose-6-phosphate isomerase-like protein (cupin superfamily)